MSRFVKNYWVRNNIFYTLDWTLMRTILGRGTTSALQLVSTSEISAEQHVSGLLRAFLALRHRNFRLFWFGQLISLTGTWMHSIGQAWLVLQLTHSALLLGVVGALQFLPVKLLSLFGGVLADRTSIR